MATTIVTKYGGDAPAASDLVRGELAVDTENGRLYTENSSGAVVEIGLNPSGNVDITGTATMDGLTVDGTSNLNGVAQVGGSTDLLYLSGKTGTHAYVSLGGSSTAADFFIGADTAIPLIFRTAGTERMRIDSTGNVGIGVTPASHSSLFTALDIDNTALTAFNDVIGIWEANTYYDGSNYKYRVDGYAGQVLINNGGEFQIKQAASGTAGANATLTQTLTVDSSGNVGIGTSSPRSILDLDGGSETQLRLQTTNSGSTTGDGLLISLDSSANAKSYIWNYENAEMIFGTNNTERMRIDASGNVGIGITPKTTNATVTGSFNVNQAGLLVRNSNQAYFASNIYWDASDQLKSYAAGYGLASLFIPSDGSHRFFNTTAAATGADQNLTLNETMRLDASGNLLVGKTANDNTTAGHRFTASGFTAHVIANDYPLLLNRLSSDGALLTFRKDSSTVGSIGTASGSAYLSGNGAGAIYINGSTDVRPWNSSTQGNYDNQIDLGASNARFKDFYLSGKVITGGNTTSNEGTISFVADSERCVITGGYDTGGGGILKFFTDTTGGTSVQRMSINNAGTVTIVGALSKGSGSFKIDHPLPEKTETHHLVHSFVESPQADNIYRGKVDLVDGSATVNIDTVSGMTEGTFVLLNTNTQCFTSNESGWTAVKGSVSGNILTITAQESCSDTISWLVIGERHDQHMLDTDWTDENGKVIVEPLKQEVAQLES